jgi:hypothetical protein
MKKIHIIMTNKELCGLNSNTSSPAIQYELCHLQCCLKVLSILLIFCIKGALKRALFDIFLNQCTIEKLQS